MKFKLIISQLFLMSLLTQGPIPEIFVKKYWELAELENDAFVFCFWLWGFSKKFCFVFSQWKSPWLLYEVAFISALFMVSLESWKRLHSNSFAHDCIYKYTVRTQHVESTEVFVIFWINWQKNKCIVGLIKKFLYTCKKLFAFTRRYQNM